MRGGKSPGSNLGRYLHPAKANHTAVPKPLKPAPKMRPTVPPRTKKAMK